MRIIAGKLKGREVGLPRGSRIRPATGSIRETVMNLFGDELFEGPFIDICAGSGLVGFEALSRGAPRVVFVETDRRTARRIQESARDFRVEDECDVLNTDARRCFKGLVKILENTPPRCIFLDPPYIMGMARDLLESLGRHSTLIDERGLIIIRAMEQLPTDVPGLQYLSHRVTGRHWLYHYAPDHSPQEPAP